MMKRIVVAVALGAAVCTAWAVVPEAGGARVLRADVVPARAWRAFHHQADSDGLEISRADDQRFEATVRLPAAGDVRVDVDWDETTGGSRLAWRTDSPAGSAAAAEWMTKVAARARDEARDNHLCRGEHPDALPEPSLEGPPTCSAGTGQFSSALFELEKCGDFESALHILAACVREQHAGGLIRLAWFFENGLGVPQRLEHMTEYLRQAAGASTPGYPETAKVQYATALYFGIGTAPDREQALRLLRESARAGNRDAAHFLRYGYHTAWRRQDGSVYADPDWRPDREGRGD